MIFLLKNKKLRIQLFLGFLLLVGAMPNGSEGLKCYECMEGPQVAALKALGLSPAECSAPKEIEKNSDGADCEVCKYAEGGEVKAAGCGVKADKTHDGCQEKEEKGQKGDVCFCEAELCNKDKATAGGGDKKGGDAGSGGPGQSTSNGKLVFTILIAPIFYGYLRGGMAEAAA